MDCLLNPILIDCASADIPKSVALISSPQLSTIANHYFRIGAWAACLSQKCDGLTTLDW